ncbi:MAG: CSLREA domain-containing protein, partial [bacterium]|nr:CSLREA domain-containing protein [bacterium]
MQQFRVSPIGMRAGDMCAGGSIRLSTYGDRRPTVGRLAVGLLAVLCALAFPTVAAAQTGAPGYTVTAFGTAQNPFHLFFDASGNLFVGNSTGAGTPNIHKITPAGGAGVPFGAGIQDPDGVVVDQAGTISTLGPGSVLVGNVNNDIWEISPTGATTQILVTGSPPAVNNPQAFAYNGADLLWVNASSGTIGILVGGAPQVFASPGGSNQRGIAVSPAGVVYVTQGNNIKRSDGTVIATGLTAPIGLAFDPGTFYGGGLVVVEGGAADQVTAVDPDTGATTVLATGFASPQGVAFSPQGVLYVSDDGAADTIYTITPDNILVDSTDNTTIPGDNKCTLPEAFENAETNSDTTAGDCDAGVGNDIISVPVGTYSVDALVHNSVTSGDLTVIGAGAGSTIIDSASGRVMSLVQQHDFLIQDLTLTGGSITGFGAGLSANFGAQVTLRDVDIHGNSTTDRGGGIAIEAPTAAITQVTLERVSIYDNQALDGGGVSVSGGTLVATNATISGNRATGDGGGVHLETQAGNLPTATLTNVTVAANTADFDASGSGDGGGLHRDTGTLNVKNTIVADNGLGLGGSGPDCAGSVTSQDYNLIENTTGCTIGGTTTNNVTGSDPALAALATNGGDTRTHEPGSGSPAIDVIPNGTNDCGTTVDEDQRGVGRPRGGSCEIGAFETLAPPTFTKAFSPTSINLFGTSTLTFTIDNTAQPETVSELAFTDVLPGTMVVATPNAELDTCGGVLTAVPGSGTITYTGGTVPASGSCTMKFDVTSSTAGANVNTSSALTSSAGTSAAASDTLTVNASATFTVTTNADSGAGSLRQAIIDANLTTDPDLIDFAIGGTPTITLASILPTITKDLVIDGSTQAGVEVDGGSLTGLIMSVTGASATLRDFAVSSAGSSAAVSLSSATDSLVENLDVSATAVGGTGVSVSSSDRVTVRNVVTELRRTGIRVENGSDVRILDNDLTNCGFDSDEGPLELDNIGSVSLPGGVLVSGNTFGDPTGTNGGFEIEDMSGLIISDGSVAGSHIIIEDSSGLNTAGGSAGALRLLNVDDTIVDNVDVSDPGGLVGSVGLTASNCDDLTVRNIVTSGRTRGINVSGGTDIQILDNDLTSSGFDSTRPALEIVNVTEGAPPTVTGGILVSGNTFGSPTGTNGGVILEDMSGLIISDGSVAGSHVILEDTSGLNTAGGFAAALRLDNIDDTLVEDVDLSDPGGLVSNDTGLHVLSNCDDLTIRDNVASGRRIGIDIDGGTDMQVLDNDLTSSGFDSTNGALMIKNVTEGAPPTVTGGILASGNTFGSPTGSNGGVIIEDMSGLIISDGSVAGSHIIIEDTSGLNTAGGSSGAMRLINVDDTLVEGVDVSDPGGLVGSSGLNALSCDDLTIRDVVTSRRRTGIRIDVGTDIQILDNDLTRTGFSSTSGPLVIRAVTEGAPPTVTGGILVSGNTFGFPTGSNGGVVLEDMSGLIISDGSVAGSHVILEDDSGLNTAGGSASVLRLDNADNAIVDNLDLSDAGGVVGSGSGLTVLSNSSNVTIRNLTIQGRNNGISLAGDGAQVECSAILDNNRAIRIESGTPLGVVLFDNHFQRSATEGVENDSTALVDAENNFWGAAGGPGSTGADDFDGNVDAVPFQAAAAACVPGDLDFGDAPDPYPTLLADDGARHDDDGATLKLGTTFDNDPDGQPNPGDATGDDTLDSGDDEDGVSFTGALIQGQAASVDVDVTDTGTAGKLNAWVDWNQNDSWGDAGEQIANDVAVPSVSGTQTITVNFTVPGGATAGSTFARFRVDSAGGLSPTGLAADGEVEDLAVAVVMPVAPTFTKAFSPSTIQPGGVSTLTFTINNTNAFALTNLDFTDTLPANVTIAGTPNQSKTCTGGTITLSGGNQITYDSGGSVAMTGTCTVQVDVTSSTVGAHLNTSSVLESAEAPDSTVATATLTVANLAVNSTADSLATDTFCTLREAISNANDDAGTYPDCPAGSGDDTITLPAGTYTLTLTGSGENANATGDLDVTDTDGLTIQGNSAVDTIIQAGTTSPVSGTCGDCVDRVMEVRTGAALDLADLTLRHGEIVGEGAGIYARSAGAISLTDVTVTDNRGSGGGTNGGAIHLSRPSGTGPGHTILRSAIVNNEGREGAALYSFREPLTLENVTISGNHATNRTGGVIFDTATFSITNSAIVFNTSDSSRGGIHLGNAAPTTVKSTMVFGNSSPQCSSNSGGYVNGGYNMQSGCFGAAGTDVAPGDPADEIDPVLALNGGTTPNHLPRLTGQAIDHIPSGSGGCGTGVTDDQRGVPRPRDSDGSATAECEIGPVELPVIPVTSTADPATDTDSLCTLREAITNANTDTDTTGGDCPAGTGPDIISIPAGTYTLAVAGAGEDSNATGDLDVTDDDGTTIVGAGARTTIIQAGTTTGNGIDRVLDFHGTGSDSLSGVTVRHGRLPAGNGGGVRNNAGSALAILEASILDNSLAGIGDGGGISNHGDLTVDSSTIAGNTATDDGGGISSRGVVTLDVVNSTLSANTAGDKGGNVDSQDDTTIRFSTVAFGNGGTGENLFRDGGTLTVESSIVANPGSGVDCSGVIVSGGSNIESGTSCGFSATGDQQNVNATALALDTLGDNGGDTDTHALLTGSAALQQIAGGTDGCGDTSTFDQRGTGRPQASLCDVGAFEAAASLPTFAKAFTSSTILTAETTTLTFTIDNSANVMAIGNLDFTDTYPAPAGSIVNATPAGDVKTCIGGVLTANDGAGSIAYTGGTVPAGGSCTVTVEVTGAAGTHVNLTGDLTSDAGNSGTATDTLTIASGFVVDSSGDTGDTSAGDGSCVASGGGCTLRAAIEEANALAGSETIVFDIGGGGAQTITLGSVLPTISGDLVIDGSTQPGFMGTPLITVDANGLGGAAMSVFSTSVTLRDFRISNSASIHLQLHTVSSSTVDGLDLPGPGSGTALRVISCDDLTIQNVTVTGRTGRGIDVSGGSDVRILNNDLTGTGSNGNPALTLLNVAAGTLPQGIQVSGNDFSGTATALAINSIDDVIISDGTVAGTDVTLEDSSGIGVASWISVLLTASDNATIDSVDLSGSGTGTGIETLTGSDNLTVQNVTIRDRGTGIRLQLGATATVSCSAILDNATGVEAANSQTGVQLVNNHFQFNSGDAVDNNTATQVDAENNFWGAAGGPGTTGADTVSGTVDTVPFLAASPACVPAKLDYGDAPSNYPTTLSDNGARHSGDGATLRIGTAFDNDPDGQPNPGDATGDDTLDSGDDEDGVTFTTTLILGVAAAVDVDVTDAGTAGVLNAWIDYNQNDSWGDAGEQIATDVAVPSVSGTQTITVNFTVPGGATSGDTYARFRVDSGGGLSPTGYAADGEVEDVQVAVVMPVAPTFTKAFSPSKIQPGAVSTLTFTIDNTANPIALTNLDFTDTLPANVTIAGTPNQSKTCTGGTITLSGGNQITYDSGGSVAASSTCTVQVDVTSSTLGPHLNTSSVLTSDDAPDSTVATATLTVANFAVDSTADNLTAGNGFCTLREAIANANADADVTSGDCAAGNGADTVTLPAGTYTLTLTGAGEDSNATGDLDVTDTLTINGAGADQTIIDGNASDRILHQLTLNMFLNDMTLRNGSVTGFGGAIVSSILTMTDMRFTGNQATSYGGAIGGADQPITCNRCLFDDNQAGGDGGAVRSFGGPAFTNATFSGNTSTGGNGGGYAHVGGTLNPSFTHCTFTGNSALTGGGIYAIGQAVGLISTILVGNTDTAAGAATDDCSIAGGNSGSYNLLGDGTGCVGTGTNLLTTTDPGAAIDTELRANGGPTATHLLLPGPAIDHVPSGVGGCGTTVTDDQRGFTRPEDGDDSGTAECDVGAVEAVIIPVTTTADAVTGGDGCSLREAIDNANDDAQTHADCPPGTGVDVIAVPAGTYTMAIAGAGDDTNAIGDYDFTDSDLTFLVGAGARSTTIDANSIDRVLHLQAGAGLIIRGLTIRGGMTATGSSHEGGGIDVENGATLSVDDSRITDNHTPVGNVDGGGINVGCSATCTVAISRSLIDNNTAGDHGAGIDFPAGGSSTLTIENSTFSGNAGNSTIGSVFSAAAATVDLDYVTVTGNTSNVAIGAIFDLGATFNLRNSIISGNTGGECNGATAVSLGYNVVGAGGSAGGCPSGGTGDQVLAGAATTLLDTLADNGGPTDTHALVTASPALQQIPAGTSGCGTTVATDQRGVARPQVAICDVGAYEATATPPELSKAFTDALLVTGTTTTLTFTIDNTANVMAVDNLAFNDDLSALGLVNATPAGGSTTCGAGVVTAANGANTISLAGGTAPAGGTCTVTVTVEATAAGAWDNVTGDLTSDAGNSGTAADTVTVVDAVIPVTSTDDNLTVDTFCTLREAIRNANADAAIHPDCPSGAGADRIELPAGTYTLALPGIGEDGSAAGDLDVTDSDGLTIAGAGARDTIIDANDIDRVIDLPGGGQLTLNGVTVRGGNNLGTHPVQVHYIGAGIVVRNSDLTVNDSRITDNVGVRRGGGLTASCSPSACTIVVNRTLIDANSAQSGGAIWWAAAASGTGASLTVNHSTLTGNSANEGAALSIAFSNNPVTLNHVTVTGNAGGGYAIGASGNSVVTLGNSIVTGNTGGIGDCNPASVSAGYNVFGSSGLANGCPTGGTDIVPAGAADTVLDTDLVDNGGPTDTHALVTGSPAVDRVPSGTNGCGTTNTSDQRGVIRPYGASCDSGAYEAGAVFTKAFVPSTLVTGNDTTLTFTVENTAGGATLGGLGFTDDLPAGVTVSNPSVTTNGCGGLLTALADATTITLAGGSVAAGTSCVVEVDVTSTTAGAHVNTTSALASDLGPASPAVATLDVIEPPAFSKEFAPDAIVVNNVSTLTFTIASTANPVTVGGLGFTDDLPANVVVAATPNIQSDCGGTFNPGVGATQLVLAGGSIDAMDTCMVSVDVTSAMPGSYVNLTQALQSAAGAGTTATDTLAVVGPPGFAKAFSPNPMVAGNVGTLTFTIDNPGGAAVGSLAFTDNLPEFVEIAAVPNVTASNCGTPVITAMAGGTTIGVTGGTVPALMTCTISVDVTTDFVRDHVNLTGDLTSAAGNSGTATDTWMVTPPFSGCSVTQTSQPFFGLPGGGQRAGQSFVACGTGDVVALDVTINQASQTGAVKLFQGSGFGSEIFRRDNATIPGGGGSPPIDLTTGDLTGSAAVVSGQTYTFSVEITTAPTVFIGHANTDPYAGGNAFDNAGTALPVVDLGFDVLVQTPSPPAFSKAFDPAFINPGAVSTLTFTIDNTGNAFGVADLDFTDNLPANVEIAATPNATTDCIGGAGGITAMAGGTQIVYSGGAVNPSSSCTVSVDVTSSTLGAHVNTSMPLDGSAGSGTVATDTLGVVVAPAFSKAFSPDIIPVNGISTLTFTINSTANATDVPGLGFVDNLPANVEVAASPDVTNDCGGLVTANAGASSITLAGGSVTTGGTCTVSVKVTGTAVGAHVNTTGALAYAGLTGSTATDTLFVNGPPTFSKAFSPNAMVAGNVGMLTFTIDNTSNPAMVTSLVFTDDLPEFVEIAATPNATTDCGSGLVTAPATGTTISLTGGSVPAMMSCTVTVDVTTVFVRDHVNLTGDLTSDAGNSGTATDTWMVIPPTPSPPAFSKAFSPEYINPGDVSTLIFTVDNMANAFGVADLTFTDDLPANVEIAASPDETTDCIGGAITANPGGTQIMYTGGAVDPSTACTVSVKVTSSTLGDHLNTSDPLDTSAGTAPAATDTLSVVVPPLFSKAFSPDLIFSGTTTTLTFTIDSMANDADVPNLAFTDNMPTEIEVAATPNATTDCGAGVVTANPATSSIALAGGTVTAGTTCIVSVTVTSSDIAIHTNLSGDLTSSAGSSGTATDDLTVSDLPAFTKAFVPPAIDPAQISTLIFTLDNSQGAIPANALDFTDVMPAAIEVAASPNASTTCAGGI